MNKIFSSCLIILIMSWPLSSWVSLLNYFFILHVQIYVFVVSMLCVLKIYVLAFLLRNVVVATFCASILNVNEIFS